MIDGATAAAIGGAVAFLVNGYGMVSSHRAERASRQTVEQTKNIANGFASGVKDDLRQIKAHLAAQDMHLVAQDTQGNARDVALAEISKTLARHEGILASQAYAQGKD